MILNISGTNGSGKSTIVRTILQEFGAKPLYGVLGPRQPQAYHLSIKAKKPVFILGPYRTPTGGADQIQPFNLIPELIERYVVQGHVLFEGMLASGSFGKVQHTMEKQGKDAIVAFMDTSLELCIKHTQERRDARGTTRVFNPKNLTDKFKSLLTARRRIEKDDIMTIIDLSRENGVKTVLKLLREAK